MTVCVFHLMLNKIFVLNDARNRIKYLIVSFLTKN